MWHGLVDPVAYQRDRDMTVEYISGSRDRPTHTGRMVTLFCVQYLLTAQPAQPGPQVQEVKASSCF